MIASHGVFWRRAGSEGKAVPVGDKGGHEGQQWGPRDDEVDDDGKGSTTLPSVMADDIEGLIVFTIFTHIYPSRT